MNAKSILSNSVILILLSYLDKSFEECLCNVRLRGEYCGTELNRRNGNNDCQKHIYFCGDNNKNKSGLILTKCTDESECVQDHFRLSFRTKRRNSCLKRFKCQCPQGIGRGPHCGSKLIGDDCPPDVVFVCRSRNRISARDACPGGCNEGKCAKSGGNLDSRERESGNESDGKSDDESDKEP